MWLTRLHDMAGVCNCVAALVRLFADSLVIFADQTELLTVFDLLLLGAQSSHVGSLVFVIILGRQQGWIRLEHLLHLALALHQLVIPLR